MRGGGGGLRESESQQRLAEPLRPVPSASFPFSMAWVDCAETFSVRSHLPSTHLSILVAQVIFALTGFITFASVLQAALTWLLFLAVFVNRLEDHQPSFSQSSCLTELSSSFESSLDWQGLSLSSSSRESDCFTFTPSCWERTDWPPGW